MNILYCGDEKMDKGLLISILSLLKHTDQPLHIFILTADIQVPHGKIYTALRPAEVNFLDKLVKQKDSHNFVKLFNITPLFNREAPLANLNTYFTPLSMLRLYVDQIPGMPDKLLYLDTDVVCRQNFDAFYNQDISNYEVVGCLDYYGRFFFHKHLLKMNYMNSGVLLLNLKEIKQTGLFAECRDWCRHKKMFMPDQSALNKLVHSYKIVPRRFNEQRKLHSDTIFQHFTTSFRFFPWLRMITVKPWNVKAVHKKLKIHDYDDILTRYQQLIGEMQHEGGVANNK